MKSEWWARSNRNRWATSPESAYGFYAVKVVPRKLRCRDASGHEINGACHNKWAGVPWPSNFAARCDQFIRRAVTLYAGSFAEARQRRYRVERVMHESGYGDIAAITHLTGRFSSRYRARLRRASLAETERFVQDAVMWKAIRALADILQSRGRVEAGEPDVAAITAKVERIDGLLGPC